VGHIQTAKRTRQAFCLFKTFTLTGRGPRRVEASAESGEVRSPLLKGPVSVRETQAKFMFPFKNERARQNSRDPGVRNKRGQLTLPIIPVSPPTPPPCPPFPPFLETLLSG